MIDKTLSFLKHEVNNFLRYKANDLSADKVEVINIVAQDGTIAHLPDSSILLTLVNVEEEKIFKQQIPLFQEQNGAVTKANPEIYLDLFVLVTSNFSDYNESLKFLSYVIGFFQSKNVFVPSSSPLLNSGINKLVAELYTLNFEQQNHLWGTLGAKYMPSVLYKIKIISIQENIAIGTSTATSALNGNIA